jgi:hypothetical protein
MKLSNPRYLWSTVVRFLVMAVAGFGTLLSARAQRPTDPGSSPGGGPPGAPFRTTVVQGVVAQYLMNPDGVIDGLLLTNNTVVRFPPHLGQVLAETVKPQDVVRVEGFFEVAGTIHALSIVDLQSRRSVVDAPPPPKNPRPPDPGRIGGEPLSVSGTIRVLTQAKGGEIDGVVLSDGTIIHFPPSVGSQFSGILQEGHALAATGHGTTNEYGRSLEADALGPSLSQLQTITGGSVLKPAPGDPTQFPSPPRQ